MCALIALLFTLIHIQALLEAYGVQMEPWFAGAHWSANRHIGASMSTSEVGHSTSGLTARTVTCDSSVISVAAATSFALPLFITTVLAAGS